MPSLTIAGTVIQFPDDSASPDWAPAVIQFAQAVTLALGSVVGAYDVTPQQFIIDAYNPGSNITIPNLTFAPSAVRSAFIKYSVLRTTTTTSVEEAGQIMIVYNPSNPTNNKWQIVQERVGNASISFTISDSGQFSLTTTALGGLNHAGKLTYSAQALSQ